MVMLMEKVNKMFEEMLNQVDEVKILLESTLK